MLLGRIFMIVTVLLILAFGVLFFASSGSYQNSLQARVEYFLGNYKEALDLAEKAHQQDRYNKMAFTLVAQSKKSLQFQEYIEQGEKYLEVINQISLQQKVLNADKIKIKMMCEVMIEEYKALSPTKMTDESLVQKSKNTLERFEGIYKELF